MCRVCVWHTGLALIPAAAGPALGTIQLIPSPWEPCLYFELGSCSTPLVCKFVFKKTQSSVPCCPAGSSVQPVRNYRHLSHNIHTLACPPAQPQAASPQLPGLSWAWKEKKGKNSIFVLGSNLLCQQLVCTTQLSWDVGWS